MPSALDQIQRQLGRSQSPTYGFSTFSRLAASGTPALSDLIAAQRATGGNRLFAQEQNQANQRRAQAGALGAFNQFQLSNQGNINQLLGLLQGGEQFGEEMGFRREQFRDMQRARRADRTYGFLNQILGIGGAIGGAALGSALAPGSGTAAGAQFGGGLFGGFGLNPRTNPNNRFSAPVGF